MKLRQIIELSELSEYREFLPRLLNERVLKFVVATISRLGRVIGYPIAIVLPTDIHIYKSDQESLRALRILGALREKGIVKTFSTSHQSYPDEPPSVTTYVTLGGESRFGISGQGTHFDDRAATLWPALGEAIERLSLTRPFLKENEHINVTWKEMRDVDTLDLEEISGFSPEEKKRKHPYFTFHYDEQTVFRWVKAKDMVDDRAIWTPLQSFSFAHMRDYVNKSSSISSEIEPLLSPVISTGAAAGQTLEDALLRGLLEVIERDAFIIYWLNQMPAKRIRLSSFGKPRFEHLLNLCARYRLELHVLYLKTDVPVHTVCIVTVDKSGVGPAIMVNAKTGTDLEETTYVAAADALGQRGRARLFFDDNKQKGKVFPKNVNEIDHKGRMYMWHDIERLMDIQPFISGEEIDISQVESYSYPSESKEALSQLLKFFKEKDYQVIYREMIGGELKDITEGLSVTKVFVPQMQPLYLEEQIRCTGGKRLREIPKLLGYDVSEKNDSFTTLPHPFP